MHVHTYIIMYLHILQSDQTTITSYLRINSMSLSSAGYIQPAFSISSPVCALHSLLHQHSLHSVARKQEGTTRDSERERDWRSEGKSVSEGACYKRVSANDMLILPRVCMQSRLQSLWKFPLKIRRGRKLGNVSWPCLVTMSCDHVLWPCLVTISCDHVI